jgi:hypothetical protein
MLPNVVHWGLGPLAAVSADMALPPLAVVIPKLADILKQTETVANNNATAFFIYKNCSLRANEGLEHTISFSVSRKKPAISYKVLT